MKNDDLKQKLQSTNSLEDVQEALKERPDLNAEQVYQELERHRSARSEKLELGELEAVNGGKADRDWVKDGCAATCEHNSWCWSNDFCHVWDVTYDNYWAKCPDGHDHDFDPYGTCRRCGYYCGKGDPSGRIH